MGLLSLSIFAHISHAVTPLLVNPHLVTELSVVLGAQSEVLQRVAACPGSY
jgi:hypothetical protein